MHLAAQHGWWTVMKWLVEQKELDIRLETNVGQTALHFAAMVKSWKPEVLKWLVERGVDANTKDNRGRTPLHYAAIAGGLGVMS